MFCPRRHTKFYYEDTLQNPKMYTKAKKYKNVYLKLAKTKSLQPILCLTLLELNQRFWTLRHDIPAVVN